MATLTKYPTANTATTGFNGTANNPTDAYTDNATYATFVPSKPRNDEDAHCWSGFGFSAIPAGSTINSVTVKVQEYVSASWAQGEWRVTLWADATTGSALTDTTPTNSIGGSNYTRATTDTSEFEWDLGTLGTEPTLAQLQASSFGVRIEAAQGNNATSHTWYVDTIEITVDYTEPAAASFEQLQARAYTDGDETDSVMVGTDSTPTLNVGELYQVRFEVEEDGGGSGTFEAQLERQLNSGSWADVNASSTVVQTLKSWSVDTTGATSTNRLDSSAETFVGSQVDVTDGRCTALTSFTGATNFVFCVYIPAGDVTHGDTINMRVRNVHADGDPTYTQSLSATVAETLTLPGEIPTEAHTHVETHSFVGPIKDTNGNLYFFSEPGFGEADTTTGRANPIPVVWKSENGGKSWRTVQAYNNTSTRDLEALSIPRTDPDTTGEIHTGKQSQSDGDINYWIYYTSDHASTPDTYNTYTTVTMATQSDYDDNVVILERSDGDLVLIEGVKPTTNRVGYRWHNGTAWQTIQYIDPGTDEHINPKASLGASDRTVVVWKNRTDSDINMRAFDSSGTAIGTTQVLNTLNVYDAAGEEYALVDVVCYDETNDYHLAIWKSTGGTLYSCTIKWNVSSYDVGTEAQVSTTTVQSDYPAGATSAGVTAGVAVDPTEGFVYVLYARSSDHDLYYNFWSESGGWDTETELFQSSTTESVGYVSAQVFTHSAGNGGARVVGYMFDTFDVTTDDDANLAFGPMYYNEVTAEVGSITASGTLNGGGGLTAVPKGLHESDSILNSGGSVTAVVAKEASTDATLNVGGSLSAVVSKQASTDATLNVGGGVSATVQKIQTTAATLNVGGSIASVVSGEHAVDSVLNAGGGVSAVAAKTVPRTATLNVGGSVTAVASQGTRYANAELNVGGGITAAVTVVIATSGTLNVGGSIPAVAVGQHAVDGTLSVGGGTTAVVSGTHKTDATLNSGGSVSATVTASTSTTVVELKFSALEKPNPNSLDIFIRHRVSSASLNSADGEAHHALYEGTTLIHSWYVTSVPTTATTVEYNGLYSYQSSITDWTDLRLRSYFLDNQGNIGEYIIYDAWLVASEAADTVDATLNGGGSITTTVSGEHESDSTLNVGGSITSTVSGDHESDSTLNVGGSITVVVSQTNTADGELNVGGSIASTVSHDAAVDTELNSGGSIATTFSGDHETDATLNVGGSIAATVSNSTTGNKQTAGTLNAGGSISSTVTGAHATDAEANAGGSVTASVTPNRATDATLNAGGSVAATVAATHAVDATLNAGGSIAAIVQKSAVGYAQLALDPFSDPSTTSGHTVFFRFYDPAATGGSVDWALMDGGLEITSGILQTSLAAPQQDSYTLLGSEAATIVNYDGLSVRLETGYGNLYVTDVWMEVPFPPPVEATLHGGGSITHVAVGHHTTRAFPKLSEGLLGPAIESGGSIAAVARKKLPGVVWASLSGGGSITATVTGPHAVNAELNAGGSITASVLPQLPGQANAILNAGGSITAAVFGWHTVSWGRNILSDDDHNQSSSIGSWKPDVYSPTIEGTCTIERVNRPLAGTTSDWEIQIDPDFVSPVEDVMISLGSNNDMDQNYPVVAGTQYRFTVLCGNLDENGGQAHLAVSWYDQDGNRLYFIESEDRFDLGSYPNDVLVSAVFSPGGGGSISFMRMHLIVKPEDPYDALVFARDFRIEQPVAALSSGGSITATLIDWIDFGPIAGPGRTDDGDDPGITDDDTDIGVTDDGDEPGDTEHVTSSGRTQ